MVPIKQYDHNIPLDQEIDVPKVPLTLKIKQVWMVCCFILSEPFFIFRNIMNAVTCLVCPSIYGLNPAKPIIDQNGVANITLFLPGQGGGVFCFLPILSALYRKGISNLYTLQNNPISADSKLFAKDPVRVDRIAYTVDKIAQQCFREGAKKLCVSIVGHSFGAMQGFKYMVRTSSSDSRIENQMLISIAGRLKYVQSPFDFFCASERSSIENTSSLCTIRSFRLVTVWGENDPVVPQESAHSHTPNRRETVKSYGHGGVLHADRTIKVVVDELVKINSEASV